MLRLRTLVVVVLVCVALAPLSGQRASRRVFIVSIDGLRPDLLLRADAPRIHALLSRSSFTFWARTVAEVYTTPSHVSMLTGVVPSRHGVTWDRYIPDAYPKVPTIFELAKRDGYTTAVVTGKTKLVVLTKPGTLTWSHVWDEESSTDLDVAQSAAEMIRDHQPQVMFVHLGQVDEAGHAMGWGSPGYMRAVTNADRAFGIIEDALRHAGVLDSTLLFVTADHGGAGLQHPPEDPRSQLIPWIVSGPSVRRNYDLTQETGVSIDTTMTFATACEFLGIQVPYAIDGKPVPAIFADLKGSAPRAVKGPRRHQ